MKKEIIEIIKEKTNVNERVAEELLKVCIFYGDINEKTVIKNIKKI